MITSFLLYTRAGATDLTYTVLFNPNNPVTYYHYSYFTDSKMDLSVPR